MNSEDEEYDLFGDEDEKTDEEYEQEFYEMSRDDQNFVIFRHLINAAATEEEADEIVKAYEESCEGGPSLWHPAFPVPISAEGEKKRNNND